MKRETLQKTLNFLMHTFTRLEYIDLHYLPAEGPVIVATNHLSRLDIPVLFLIPTRPDITALVTDKYKGYPFLKWFVVTAQAIWIDRTKADFTAFRAAYEVLKEGRALGISPEGTRSETGKLLEGKSGTILIASKTGVPVVPVALMGTENSFPKIFTLQRPRITARFGQALIVPPLDRDNREEQLKAYTEELMCRMAALLPEKYRGFYRDYPRVKELIAESSQPAPSKEKAARQPVES